MTAVGGTSFFGTFDPGKNAHPTYPAGKEYVWDSANTCTRSDFSVYGFDISSVFGLCPFGAGGGGNSMLWAKAPWQQGSGVTSPASESGAYCGQASGVQCREVPDISLDADPGTGYAVYCTDPAAGCVKSAPWGKVGGTSSSAPLWAGIVALAESFGGHRVGLATSILYTLDNPAGYSSALHDMVGSATYTFDWTAFLDFYFNTKQVFAPLSYTTDSNGYGTPSGFVETPNYDMATGLGTPNVDTIVPALAAFV